METTIIEHVHLLNMLTSCLTGTCQHNSLSSNQCSTLRLPILKLQPTANDLQILCKLGVEMRALKGHDQECHVI